eukprot:TRINITY_DN47423_c0_g1_i1.p1 TRINITY_DN47423_c0_g1~~TRINITY_DN47423_c0_g1_i1.p1  ORF type:complete len:262 (-),score=47.68 TRINITY_DN47423_c0_g1_i1:70-798(-)
MPRYRLYKSVVAGVTGQIGEALTKQLLLSPLCSEVHAAGRRATSAFKSLAAAESKLRQHQIDISRPNCGVDASELEGVNVAFCTLGSRSGWGGDAAEVAAVERDGVIRFAELCAAAKVPHFTLLTSAWADKDCAVPGLSSFAKPQGEAVAAISAMESFQRVSIFKPSAALDAEGQPMGRPGLNLFRGMPLAAQFLPTRFRPVPMADIVLAMRLNAELCDPTQRVEELGFQDMMQIIGREGDV